MAKKVLVVDDEKLIVKGIRFSLEQDGMEVDCAYDGEEALNMAKANEYDMILLDIMLPKMDGFEVCQAIREFSDMPIVMLTAKGDDMDKILGLGTGADDYVTKPFNPLEMVSRVKAQLRRYTLYNGAETLENKEIFDSAGLIVNHQTHVCTLYEKEIALTPTEFNILWLLCKNAGKVVSTEEIFEKIWNEKYLDSNNTVMVHIRRIREKLNEPSRNPKFIKTVWGVGYKIEKK